MGLFKEKKGGPALPTGKKGQGTGSQMFRNAGEDAAAAAAAARAVLEAEDQEEEQDQEERHGGCCGCGC